MQKEALKKHHFWILFGLVPLFVLIGTLVVSSSVGSQIAAREAEINKSQTAIKAKSNPKPEALIAKMDKLIDEVKGKQDGLWKDCYVPQRTVYSTDAMLSLNDEQYRRDFAKILVPVEKLKFGDPIPNDDNQYGLFERKEIYQDWYENLAKKLRPTSFANGWQNTLRWVNGWTDAKLTSNQIWLILEDMWVQKSLMEGIASINEQMAEFSRVKFERNGQVIDDPADKEHQDPLRRKFRGRTWEVELEVVSDGAKRYLKGRLINITDRLQLLGVGNTMTLNVWLEAGDRSIQPFPFRISNEFVPGAGGDKAIKDKDGNTQKVPANVLEVTRLEDHAIPAGMGVSEIARVEQVFDARTVPVHVIQSLALGYADSRNADFTLKPPPGKAFEEPVAATEAPGGSPQGGGSQSGGPGTGGPTGGLKGLGGSGGRLGMGQGSSGPQTSGGGPVASVIDSNKKRYIEATDQVRRMPVAMTVVVDQSFLQDVLMAMANSSLRFQITQVTWKRFRGQLDLGGPGGSSPSDPSGNMTFSGQFQFGNEFSGGGSRMPPRGGPMPGGGPGPRRPGMGGPPMGSGSGMGIGGLGGLGGLQPTSTVSESQLTSGLIELTVYGIVSLYASPEAAAADAAKKEGEPKKDAEPAKKDAAPGAKKDAAPGTKKEPAKGIKEKDKEPAADKDKKDEAPADKDKKGEVPADKDTKPKAPADADPKTPKR